MIYLLWCPQLEKIIVTEDIQASVQSYNNPDYEFELLARTNDEHRARQEAEAFAQRIKHYGHPTGGLLNDGPKNDIKLS